MLGMRMDTIGSQAGSVGFSPGHFADAAAEARRAATNAADATNVARAFRMTAGW
jgi:hypothetical protein